MSVQPTPRDSTGARFGQQGFSTSLGSRDPRQRRAAQADQTNTVNGAFVKRDEIGRETLDIDALVAELVRRGFARNP